MTVEITGPFTVAETKGLSAVYTIALTELFASGIGPGDGGVPYYYKDKAICARVDGNISGFIAYRGEKDSDGTLNVMCGWVEPKLRHLGIYSQLWSKLVEIAKKEGYRRIWGSTHVNNLPMRAFYKKLGRVETHVQSIYELE